MAVIPFAEYRPDVSDINAGYTSQLANVLPRADGYGPANDLEALTAALPAACRGYFQAQNPDGSVIIFAATANDLYVLNNAELDWTLASKDGGPYSDVAGDAHWKFVQFNNFILATHANVTVQVYDLTSSTEFDDLAGSPPQSGGIAILNRFVVLYDILGFPNRIQWSGLNAVTTWTSGTNYSDYQDFPDGGRVRGVAGGEYGVVLQERAIRRMVFVPGAAITFQIEKMDVDRGIFAPNSLCQGGGRIFFFASTGFVEMVADGSIRPIGFEKVDRTVLADLDRASMRSFLGAADPTRYVVLFVWKSSTEGNVGQFNRGLAYNWLLERWAPISITGEHLATAAVPGATLEGLDLEAPEYAAITNAVDNGAGLIRLTVTSTTDWATGDYKTVRNVLGTTEANGLWQVTVIDGTTADLQGSTFANAYVSGGIVAGELDSLPLSLDDLDTVALPALSAFTTSHELAYFTGDTLEATMETAETIGTRQRVHVNGVQPITDAATCHASIGAREKLNGALTYGTESQIDADGYCPLLESVRSARAKLRVPAAETWTFATGIEPELMPAGRF